MEKRIKSIKSIILICSLLCTLFVAFISYQSWGTIEYVSENIPNDMADIQWFRLTLITVRYLLALALVATLIAFLTNIWRGASSGRLFVRGNHRWLYAMTAIYFVYSLVDGNAGKIIYQGIRQLEIYINEYMLITCFVLLVFAKLYSIAVDVSEEQELTI
ncbi:MAG: hypothetical protein ACI4A8_04215 [Muribaculaceae bacterium]